MEKLFIPLNIPIEEPKPPPFLHPIQRQTLFNIPNFKRKLAKIKTFANPNQFVKFQFAPERTIIINYNIEDYFILKNMVGEQYLENIENLDPPFKFNFPFKLADSGKIINFLSIYKVVHEKKGRKIKFGDDSQVADEKYQELNEKGVSFSILKKKKNERNKIFSNFPGLTMRNVKNLVDQSRKISYEYYQDNFSSSISDNSDSNNEENVKISFGTREETIKLTAKGKEVNYLLVTEMNDIEKVFVDFNNLPDQYPLKKQLKCIILYFR